MKNKSYFKKHSLSKWFPVGHPVGHPRRSPFSTAFYNSQLKWGQQVMIIISVALLAKEVQMCQVLPSGPLRNWGPLRNRASPSKTSGFIETQRIQVYRRSQVLLRSCSRLVLGDVDDTSFFLFPRVEGSSELQKNYHNNFSGPSGAGRLEAGVQAFYRRTFECRWCLQIRFKRENGKFRLNAMIS